MRKAIKTLKGECSMTINYEAKGSRRKELATAVADLTRKEKKYLGMPSMAYQIGPFTVDKEGNLQVSNEAIAEEVDKLIAGLLEKGFEEAIPEGMQEIPIEKVPEDEIIEESHENEIEENFSESEENESSATGGAIADYTITVAVEMDATDKVLGLIARKERLILHALGIASLDVAATNDGMVFTCLQPLELVTPEEIAAASVFFSKVCELAKNLKRTNRREHTEVPNEKYAMRCFLIRLGMVGDEYKEARKILLARLTGSAAFRDGKREADSNEA